MKNYPFKFIKIGHFKKLLVINWQKMGNTYIPIIMPIYNCVFIDVLNKSVSGKNICYFMFLGQKGDNRKSVGVMPYLIILERNKDVC